MATAADKKAAGNNFLTVATQFAAASTALAAVLDEGDVVYAPSRTDISGFQKLNGKIVPAQVVNLESP